MLTHISTNQDQDMRAPLQYRWDRESFYTGPDGTRFRLKSRKTTQWTTEVSWAKAEVFRDLQWVEIADLSAAERRGLDQETWEGLLLRKVNFLLGYATTAAVKS